MTLLHKLPPVIAALAFGYGIGMAAPDSAISSVRAAVTTSVNERQREPQRAEGEGARTVVQVPYGAPGAAQGKGDPAWVLGGSESRELGKLRDTRSPDEGRERASCDLDRPMFSRPPRYESQRDREVEDVDELDTTGVEALSKLQLPDLKVSITRRTLKYVRFFTRTDRGRGMFEAWLTRSGRYQELIQTQLREWRLPEDLIWVAMIESGFDPRAKSPAGAVGLWQFMPATGEVYGLSRSQFMDQRKNPRLATQAAAHHLRDLYMRFGNWDLALAAYNMGYEQLLDAIDRYGTTDFNELARQQAIPSETASYVPKIAAAAIVANNIERFGFDKVEVRRPIDAAEIAVPPRTPLRTLAKAAGVSTATIRSLNPDLLSDKVPPGRGDYLVMIPADTFSRAMAALPAMLETEPLAHDASVLDPVSMLSGRELSVKRARRDDESLLSLLPPPKKRRSLRDPGEELEARFERERDRDSADDEGDEEPARRKPRRARSSREVVMYRVGPGDTLVGIARQFAADIEDVARENDLDTDAKLRAGSLLKLRVRREMLDQAPGDAPRAPDVKGEDKERSTRERAEEPKGKSEGKGDAEKGADRDEKKERRKKSRG
jgi:membrane-bound lytic murein transglycosylase D